MRARNDIAEKQDRLNFAGAITSSMAQFGSVLREDFTPESEIDVPWSKSHGLEEAGTGVRHHAGQAV